MDGKIELGIIGCKGTVGGTLYNQAVESKIIVHGIHRNNFNISSEYEYKILIITCFDARKYYVNQNPIKDLSTCLRTIEVLTKYKAEKVILISTVDVYEERKGDETSELSFSKPGYGHNRHLCELYIKSIFDDCSIVRLQGLVGNKIKKNYLFDIKHDNNVELIDSTLLVQYYPLERLMKDINTISTSKIGLVNLSCYPLSLETILNECQLSHLRSRKKSSKTIKQLNYNVTSIYSSLSTTFAEKNSHYWVEKDEILESMKTYFKI